VKLEKMAIDVYRMFKSAFEGKGKIPYCTVTFEWVSSFEKGVTIKYDPYFSHLLSHCEDACLDSY
jgi:predicted AAA+ superfamily ATPase